MRKLLTSVAIVAGVVFLGVLGLGGSCNRPCETSANCKRTCECVNTNTSAELDCTLAFRCEVADRLCESDYNAMTCDDICETYAATGTCGFERCLTNADCEKRLSCAIVDPSTKQPTGQFRDCFLPFECNQGAELCDVRSTATQDDLCRNECAQAPIGG